MKISNGCWIQKEGITAFFPQEVYFCDVKKGYGEAGSTDAPYQTAR